jgi:hypothetical protein
MPALNLDADWRCAYFEIKPDLYEFARDEAVTSLANWSFDKRRVANWAAWLKRDFELQATDFCVSYYLYLDEAPEGAQIYINGEQVAVFHAPGPDAPPYELDVTPYVSLGQNELAFRLQWDMPGEFVGVRLQPVPCD